jgi:hypothetical protein
MEAHQANLLFMAYVVIAIKGICLVLLGVWSVWRESTIRRMYSDRDNDREEIRELQADKIAMANELGGTLRDIVRSVETIIKTVQSTTEMGKETKQELLRAFERTEERMLHAIERLDRNMAHAPMSVFTGEIGGAQIGNSNKQG